MNGQTRAEKYLSVCAWSEALESGTAALARLVPDDRASEIRFAKIMLREARERRDNPVQRGFCFWLLGCAANARRRVMALPRASRQAALFPDEAARS